VAHRFYNSALILEERLYFGKAPIFWKSTYILERRLYFGKAPVLLTFSFAQLAKGKSLGHSKPTTNQQYKHCNTLCGLFLLYPSLTELPSIEIK
jgi:hypothetical protein